MSTEDELKWKSRELSLDYGTTGSAKYNAVMTAYFYTPTDPIVLQGWHNWYADYVPTHKYPLVQMPSFSGYQVFGSTRRRFGVYNDCSNIKVKGVNLPFTTEYKLNSESFYRRLMFHRLTVTDELMPNVTGINSHFEYDTLAVSRRAWYHLQPHFEARISMLNFLFEMKDFRDISNMVPKTFSPSNVKRLLDARRRHPWTPKPKDVADAWLINAFAIQPLIKDVAVILQEVSHMANEAYNKFYFDGLETQNSHYSENIFEWDDSGDYLYPFTQCGFKNTTKFTASMQYRYCAPILSPAEAFARFWGLIPTAEVVWNALPFSFLVDYGVRIADTFKALGRVTDLSVEMMQYSESLLSLRRQGIWTDTDSGGTTATLIVDGTIFGAKDNDKLLAGVDASYYSRVKKLPTPQGLYAPRLKLPSRKQAINMLALATSFI
jgi:hypothetical protein